MIDRKTLELFQSIDIAKHSKEQNVDIVFQNGLFYFKVNQDINSSLNKLFAWFCEELSSQLPSPSMTTLNGTKRFYCNLCNQIFIFPNPVVIHVLFECPKRHEILFNYRKSVNPSVKSELPSSLATKKRGFDIESLVNDDKVPNESAKKLKNESEVKSAFRTPLLSSHCSFSESTSSAILNSMTSTINSTASNSKSHSASLVPSAFRRVDKTSLFSGELLPTNLNQLDLTSLNTIYSVNSINCPSDSSILFPTRSNFVPYHSDSLLSTSSSLSLNGSQISNDSSSSTSGSSNTINKQSIPPSLLPFLPPSLAALSFPQTNWCAKCNSTFRMTSDLVYHMRSHHKREAFNSTVKKRREEKLCCNICGEKFRERHHLTRHMTSHQ